LADFNYSYLLYAIDIAVKLSKLVVVQHAPPTTHILSSVFVSNYRVEYNALLTWNYGYPLKYYCIWSADEEKDSNPLNPWIWYCSDHSEGQIVYSPDRERHCSNNLYWRKLECSIRTE